MPYLYRPNAGRPVVPYGYASDNEFDFSIPWHVIMDPEQDYAARRRCPESAHEFTVVVVVRYE